MEQNNVDHSNQASLISPAKPVQVESYATVYQVNPLTLAFFKKGFQIFGNKSVHYSSKHKEFIKRISSHPKWFHENPKDVGTLVLDFKQVNEPEGSIQKNFVDMLFETGVIKRMYAVLQRPFYLANFMHMVTPPGAPALGWHRDSYVERDGAVGLIPPPVKLSILHGDVDENAAFECVPGSHRVDFHSRWIDRLYRILSTPWHMTFCGKEGEAVLFDVSLLHRRRAGGRARARSATIFAFATAKEHLGHYIERHPVEIRHFIKNVKEQNLFDIGEY